MKEDPEPFRVERLLFPLAVVIAVVLFVFAMATIPAIYDSRDTTADIHRTNDLATCRAQARLGIDDATAALLASLASLVGSGTNPAAVADVHTKADQLRQAQTDYAELLQLAHDNPQGFLDQCRHH